MIVWRPSVRLSPKPTLCQKPHRRRPRGLGSDLARRCLLRGSTRAVTTCCERICCRPDILGKSGPQPLSLQNRLVRIALLFARLSDRCGVRLLAPVEDDQAARRTDGAAPCRRSVLLLHARRDPRRTAGLCSILYRRRHRHPQRFHRFLGRRIHLVEAAAALGRRHELPRRRARRARGNRMDFVAQQALLPARVRLYRGQCADGLYARAARELRQWRAVGPRNRCFMGHGVPPWWKCSTPSQPALSGGDRRVCAAGHHDAVVLEDQGALSPGSDGRRVHRGNGRGPLH